MIDIHKTIELRDDLDYLLDKLKTDNLGYLDVGELEKAKEEIEKDIAEYQRLQQISCPALKEGNIIRISHGDGISYSQRDYYKINELTDTLVKYDLLTVTRGDYGNEIKLDETVKEKKVDWINKYNRNYHKDDITEEEWNTLVKYTRQIPWL